VDAQITAIARAASTEKLVPINDAAGRLGRSVGTLKRMHRKGCLAAVIMQGHWFVPESFIRAVLASPRPAKAGSIEDIARDWFAANGEVA
jgi:hypothetical protein